MASPKSEEIDTSPEHFLKEMVDFEAVLVIIIERDGKIQNCWFRKKTGNGLFHRMAMRAIKEADPLPLIPKKMNEKTLKAGFHFLVA